MHFGNSFDELGRFYIEICFGSPLCHLAALLYPANLVSPMQIYTRVLQNLKFESLTQTQFILSLEYDDS